MDDLTWLISHGYEVSIEAGDNRTGEVCGADIAVRLDRSYWSHDEVFGTVEYQRWIKERTFWGEESGISGALKKAREWAEAVEDGC